MSRARLLTLIACTAIIGSSRSSASPRNDASQGRAVFTGSTLPQAATLTLDPASLGLSTWNEVYVAVTSLISQIRIDQRELDVDSGTLTQGARVRETLLSPGASLGLVYHPSEGGRLALGVEARIPPAEHQLSSPDVAYHTYGGRERTYLATVGVSLRATRALYIGASLSHENRFVRLRYLRDTALEGGGGPAGIGGDCSGAPCGVENPEAAELYAVDVRSPLLATENFRLHLGIAVRVHPDVWVGIAYHTPPGFGIQTNLEGSMLVTRAPRDGGFRVEGDANVLVSLPASVDGEVRTRLPSSLSLHVGGRWQDLSRLRSYDVRGHGSTFPSNGIPEWTIRARGFHDSFALWAGVEQDSPRSTLALGGRVGFQTSELDDEDTAPWTIAPFSMTADVGLQWRIQPTALLQVGYGVQYYPTVSVRDGAAFDPRHRIACIDNGFDYSSAACAAVRNGYAISTSAGDYDRLDHSLRVALRYVWP